MHRLEQVVKGRNDVVGLALFLTHERQYWCQPQGAGVLNDGQFRLHDGRSLNGHLQWAPTTSPGTKKRREGCFTLNGNYHLSWKPYGTVPGNEGKILRKSKGQAAKWERSTGGDRGTAFKYLLVEVKGSGHGEYFPMAEATSSVEGQKLAPIAAQ